MEEEIICSSLLHSTDSVLQQPQQDSWTSAEHQYISGEQEVTVLDETETEGEIIEAHGTDELTLSPRTGRESPDEAEQWDHIIFPVRPSASLSFATVQWDMPDLFTERPSLVIDRSLANELDSSSVTSLGTTPPSLHQSEDDIAALLVTEEREELDRFNSQLLSVEWTGSSFEPCDAADVQEPTTQEKEDSTHELLDSNNEIPVETESEDEDSCSVTSDPAETVDIIETVWEAEGSEDEANCLADVKLEEEPEELSVLLTAQGDPEEQQNAVNGVEIDEEGEEGQEEEDEEEEEDDEEEDDEEEEVEEEEEEDDEEEEEGKRVTNVLYADDSEEANTVSCPSYVEVTAEPIQTEDAGLTPDKLIHLHPSEFVDESCHSGTEEDVEIQEQLQEDSTGRTEETEMCKGVDHNVEPEQPEAVDNSEEELMQETENAEKTENLEAIPELDEEAEEEESRLEEQYCDQTTSPHPERSECEELETIREPEPTQAEVSHQIEEEHSDQLGCQHLKESPEMEPTNQSARPETAEGTEECTQSDQMVCVEDPEVPEQQQQQQTEPPEQNESSPQTADVSQPTISEQHVLSEDSDESEITEQLPAEPEVTEQTAEAAELNQVGSPALQQAEELTGPEDGGVRTVMANGEKHKLPPETPRSHMNGGEVDREMARRLAEKLFKLDGIQPVDVVKHLDKDNDFSHAVGEEYLKFFDFTGQTLDQALRSFLKVVVLIGESQERERVLQHFARHFHQCNPDTFPSSGAVLALTCALMLLNTDLHGQHVGKSMSSSQFVSNLDGMNEGENFSKDLLKSLYNSIKSEPLEWAVNENELQSSVLLEEDVGDDAQLRSKANPFQVVAHDKNALVVKEGFLLRKLHADIDGKRTPWGKRGWKTFYGVLRGMVLYLQKDDYKRDHQVSEEVVSVHHSVAEPANDYTKKPHVFRLQTADWRVFLFQASSKVEMKSWISRFNLVSALHSSPPFPAAVGSQRKFFRPILPASQSAHTLERQLQFHAGKLESFKADLSDLQQNPPEGRKARAKELEEQRVRAEYLHYEMCRYEIYIQMLEAWKKVEKTGNKVLSTPELNLFDKALCADSVGEEDEEDGGLKKSHSSPSLEQEMAPPTVIKVRRNISERRTYRRTIIPRWNKEA